MQPHILCLYEIQQPQHFWHEHVGHVKFRFSGTPFVQFNFPQIAASGSLTQLEDGSFMSRTVPVHIVRSVHIPFQHSQVLHSECQLQEFCPVQILQYSFQLTPVVFVRILYSSGKECHGCLDVSPSTCSHEK